MEDVIILPHLRLVGGRVHSSRFLPGPDNLQKSSRISEDWRSFVNDVWHAGDSSHLHHRRGWRVPGRAHRRRVDRGQAEKVGRPSGSREEGTVTGGLLAQPVFGEWSSGRAPPRAATNDHTATTDFPASDPAPRAPNASRRL